MTDFISLPHAAAAGERDAFKQAVAKMAAKCCSELDADERQYLIDCINQAADDAYFKVLDLYEQQADSPSGMFHPDALTFEQRGLTRRARRPVRP